MVTPSTNTWIYASNRATGACSIVNGGSDMDNVTINFSMSLICEVGSLAERIIMQALEQNCEKLTSPVTIGIELATYP